MLTRPTTKTYTIHNIHVTHASMPSAIAVMALQIVWCKNVLSYIIM